MMEDKEIEVLDIEEDVKNIEENVKEESSLVEAEPTKKVVKRRLKKGVFQTIFCLVSLIFIIGCCIFYGSRLIKYYKIYNPKSESGESIQLISNALIQDTPIVFEGSGIYRESGIYVYKGKDANNYIKYSNMIWRIIRTNSDGSLEIILDDYINSLAWDFEGNNYSHSDINKYLNDGYIVFLDRYVSSNMAHQGGKLTNKEEREKIFKWIETLEYDLLELPKPDITIFLHMPYVYAKELKKNRNEIDKHEENKEHLINSENTYLELANLYNYKTIECVKDNQIKSIDSINDEVFNYLKDLV